MELFTKTIDAQTLTRVIQNLFRVKEVNTSYHDGNGSLIMLNFSFDYREVTIFLHTSSERYGFVGSLMSIQVKNFHKNEELPGKIIRKLANTLGGIMVEFPSDQSEEEGETSEGFQPPGADSTWILNELLISGVEDSEISQVLEELKNKKELIRKSDA